MKLRSELTFAHLPGSKIILDGFTMEQLDKIETVITLNLTTWPDAPNFHEVDRRLSQWKAPPA